MLELTITVKRNNKEIMLTAEQLKAVLYMLDDLLEKDRIDRNKKLFRVKVDSNESQRDKRRI